jgi:hypothetical protein
MDIDLPPFSQHSRIEEEMHHFVMDCKIDTVG